MIGLSSKSQRQEIDSIKANFKFYTIGYYVILINAWD